jgi:hypothetical protein
MHAQANDRGGYGSASSSAHKGLGSAGILPLRGVAIGIYVLSPEARHFYKHGRLPPARW